MEVCDVSDLTASDDDLVHQLAAVAQLSNAYPWETFVAVRLGARWSIIHPRVAAVPLADLEALDRLAKAGLIVQESMRSGARIIWLTPAAFVAAAAPCSETRTPADGTSAPPSPTTRNCRRRSA